MIKMEDVYYNIDSYITDNGFYASSADKQKELVDTGLKMYLAKKIHYLDSTKSLREDKLKEVTVTDLIYLLGEMIPENQHSQTLSHVVRYLLGNASLLQGKRIKWERENDLELVDCTQFEFNDRQQITVLRTHVYPNYPQTIRFIYDLYQSGLLHQKGKEYSKKKEQ